VQTVTSHTVVDLVNPEMVVMVEVLPLVGSQSSLVCALSVLPKELVVTKPKLVVKPLVQPKKRKHTS
jgi:tRNA(Ser,Leu) C12 N-acetylase TAN1